MSIINTFDNHSEEILKPSYITHKIEGFPEIVLVTFKDKILEIAVEKYGGEKINEMHAGVVIPVYKLDYNGLPVAIYPSMLGGSVSTALMEEMAVKGGKKFVFFGSCGTLDKSLSARHLIVPISAYRDEGTSYHYAPAGDYMEVKTAGRMAQILGELELPYVCGKVWTTDGFYRETRDNMEKRRSEGCIAVDMECASVMAAGQFRGYDIYQFLYAEDNLDNELWDSRTMGKVPRSADEQHLRIALEIASKI